MRLPAPTLAPLALAALLAAAPAAAQVSIPGRGVPLTESFDTLSSSVASSTMPVGWAFLEGGTNANGLYAVGNGSSNAGDTYSFGATGSAERALGGLQSGSLVPTLGASFRNDTGSTITELVIAYSGEQWRLGTANRGPDRLDFQYSVNATGLGSSGATWIDVDALDFSSPITTGVVGALDGNANHTLLTATIPVNIAPGATFWIRWTDFNASGADDGLAVDDFALTANGEVTTNPSGVGAASPNALLPGETTRLTVTVTPGSGPPSTGLAVRADLTSIGGTAAQSFFDDGTSGDAVGGDNVFTFRATVAPGTSDGPKTLTATITDAQSRSGTASIMLTVLVPPHPSTTVVVSQLYGGGGNSGATLKNDFVELYNLGSTTVDLTGWSVQYASASGTTWQTTPLSGSIDPGRYYLVQEAAGTGGTVSLPPPNTVGSIAMSATSGKVALVSSATALGGGCPVAPAIVDFVGYGSASCAETSPTPGLGNTTAALRNGDGAIDTNDNSADFTVGAPDPRNSAGRPPSGVGAAVPASISAGESTLLTVSVVPGSHPDSSGVNVRCDLTAILGAVSQPFFDDETNGDATPGDDVFSFQVTVAGGIATGSKSLFCTVADAQGRSTSALITLVVEPALVAIHAIQGPTTTSLYAGQLVTTKGVVTGLKFNGFYIQTPDAEADVDPATSEGVFVFTNSLPTVSVGDLVKVAGTVSEFIPPQDPVSPPVTEISGSPAVTLLSSGNPLPAPVTLTAADTSPTGTLEQLERFEGMRVHVDALRVVAPTQRLGSIDEVHAEVTSNGVFYGVVDGIARPAREPGIPRTDPLPPGAPCCIPRFDENPERLRVDSDGQPGGTALEVTSGALVTNLTGPLDFSFRTWTILPDPATPPAVSGLGRAVPVPEASENEFTVGSFNMERFFDTKSDGTGEPVLTEEAFQKRLDKASLAIRNVMRSPDVIGVEEMENLTTLQALAAKVNGDAVTAGEADPGYTAYLVEGNDVGGIDVGILVKTARVNVIDVTQVGKDATYINPTSGAAELLNDRPPLVLRATIQGPVEAPFPLTVIVNHLRSLSGIDDPADGARVRAKRRAQAEFLANLIQARQAADPSERIASVGDYNAFPFSDGYVDVVGTVKGTPTPPDQVMLASADLVNPDLTNLVDLLPSDQAYSYSFDGDIQTLDHVLVNASLMKRFSRFHYARSDADFPETYRNDPDRPERLSDHDMPVAYFAFPGAPKLVLIGPNPMTVECHGAFADPGATASDADLGDLTADVQVTGHVDPDAVGSYVLTYSVSNGFLTTTMTRTVSVVDTTPPVITLLGGGTVTVELGGAFVDPGATALDTCAGDLTGHIEVTGRIDTGRLGSYTLTYTVSDGYNTAGGTRTVNVVDTTPPTVGSASASPGVLWPPNHRMVPVVVSVSASDLSGPVTCSIVSVGSNEPANGLGDGDTAPDWMVTGDLTLTLRAERSGRGGGRVYTITVRCPDAAGNAATTTASVGVPHDQSGR